MIRIIIGMKPKGATEVAKNLEKYRKILHARVRNTVQELGRRLVSTAKDKYLSGPRPSKLGVLTGRLRNSINAIDTEEGDTILLRFGTNVKYARIHEKGFNGMMMSPAHARVVKQAFGRRLKSPVTSQVKAHRRKVNMPARPFLGPSMEDNKKWLSQQIRETLREMTLKAMK